MPGEFDTPIHKHDCGTTNDDGPGCIYLGSLRGEDVYLCAPGDAELAELVIRRSGDGPDYISTFASDKAIELIERSRA